MTAKTDFTEEEWTRLKRAPFVAGMAISLADPGGPIEATKETMATTKTATNPPSREQLLAEVALDVQAMAQQHQQNRRLRRQFAHARPEIRSRALQCGGEWIVRSGHR